MKRINRVGTFMTVALAVGMSASAFAPALAQGSFGRGVFWTHNGSWMTITRNGGNLRILYDEPRRGLSALRGSTLFRGRIRGNSISGTAYTFKRGCRPAPYSVSGRVSGGRIVLSGAAPVRRGSCRVQGYSANSSNANLVFRYAGTGD